MRTGVIKRETGPVDFALKPGVVSSLFNISYRQLQYWDDSDFIKPSHKDKSKHRVYGFQDLIVLYIIWTLRRKNKQSVQRMRRLVKVLRKKIFGAGPYLEGATLIVIPDTKRVVDRVVTSYGEVNVSDEETWEGVSFPIKEIRDKIEKALAVGEYEPPKGLSAAQANKL